MGSGQPVAIRGHITFTNKFAPPAQDSWLRVGNKTKLRRIGNKKSEFLPFHHNQSPARRLNSPIHPRCPLQIQISERISKFAGCTNRRLTGRLLNSDKFTTICSESNLLKLVT